MPGGSSPATPRPNLLAELGTEVLELRLDEPERAVATLREAGVAADDILVIGTTVTVVLRGRTGADVVRLLARSVLALRSSPPVAPDFDDVYLRLTGDHFDGE